MRFSALVPFLLSLAALVLSFLCLFAGSKKSFLQGADIMTVRLESSTNSSNAVKLIPCLAQHFRNRVLLSLQHVRR